MANILELRTVGNHTILVVDADPAAAAGTPAVPSSIAMLDGTPGHLYMKFGALDTDWSEVANNGSYVNDGIERRLALYATTGTAVDDVLDQNSQPIIVEVTAQPTRSAGITYSIPNPGDAVTAADFVLTEGAQTINGNKTFGNDVTIQGNLDVNGTLTTIDTVNLQVTDKLITLNRQGAAASADGSGIELEEDGSITGYIKTSADRFEWCFKAPAATNAGCFNYSNLTADQMYYMPDVSGYLQVAANQNGVDKQITYYNATLQLDREAGTGSDALTWDYTTNRLGVRTATPARALDVAGDSIFRNNVRIENATGVNYEIQQASVLTTTNAQTTLSTVATATDSVMLIEARIVARRTGGSAGTVNDSASYVRTARVKNTGGTVTVLSIDSMYTSEDQSLWNSTFTVSGTNVLVRVTGATNNNITWWGTIMTQVQV